jgi:triacylglycerol lipase
MTRTSCAALVVMMAMGTGCSSFARPHASNLPEAPALGQQHVAYPVVLVHGFAGFSNFGWMGVAYFNEIERNYRDKGIVVSAPALPPYNSSEVRARFIRAAVDEVLQSTGAKKVHIIAHSQGGLDARFLINVMGYGDRVATLTTISSPHRGTPLADQAQHVPPAMLQSVFWMMASVNGAPPGVDLGEIDARAALQSVSTSGMAHFNKRYPDDPRVPIFSMAAVVGSPRDGSCDDGAWGPLRGQAAPAVWLTPTWTLLSGKDPDRAIGNDGVVTAASAKWGTFLGCIPVDHVSVVGVDGPTLEAPDAAEYAQGELFLEYLERLRAIEHGADASVMTLAPPSSLPRARDRDPVFAWN